MTSMGTGTSSKSSAYLVGCSGMGEWGKKNPQWYPCVVKADNKDGTIKVQWDEDKKFTFRLPVDKFRLVEGTFDEDPMEVPLDVLFKTDDDGDY